MRDIVKGMAALVGAIALSWCIVYALTSASLPLVNKQTQIARASNGYVTAQQEALADEEAAYLNVARLALSAPPDQRASYEAQEAAIVQQMRIAVSKIPGNVPSSITLFLGDK